jgi:hypothetical protein
VDLRRSSPPSSLPDLRFAIPAARQPFPQLTPTPHLSHGSRFGQRAASDPTAFAVRLRHRVNLAEGALVLIGAYILIGAGIGEAAGSVAVGIAAILLISGSAQAARAATDRGPRRVPPRR